MDRRSNKFRTFVLVLVLLLINFANDAEAKRKSGGSGGSGWSIFGSRGKSKSSSTSTSNNRGGSRPGVIGWSVPSASQSHKPSAPSHDHVQKSSATNSHSSYPSSGNYGHANPPPSAPSSNQYHPSSHTGGNFGAPPGYNHGAPPVYTPHGSPPGYGSHAAPPPYNPHGSYHPNSGYGYGHNQPGPGFNPTYGGGVNHGFSPNIGAQPQTILLQSQRPGVGQLAKEALVFAGVNTAVNAAASRLIPGGIYGHSGYGGRGGEGGTHTQITYNNYYNNGTSSDSSPQSAPVGVPASNAGQPVTPNQSPSEPAPATNPVQSQNQPAPTNNEQYQNFPDQSGYLVSNNDLTRVSEELYNKEHNNANQHISMNLQSQKTNENTTDDAPDRLLSVASEAYEIPTVKAVRALHDNYNLDVRTKEDVTSDERKEESDLLDVFLTTDVMKTTMQFLADKGYIPNDEYEFKDTLKRIWFSQFKRIDSEPSSSGFEVVFLAEKLDKDIIGLHNWIYYAKQEEEKKINYLGYFKKVDLGNKGAIIKVQSMVQDIAQPFTTLFVGTSPELEMALYTICFYTRPNDVCPLSLGGSKFVIVANRVNYFGKDILIAAFPDI